MASIVFYLAAVVALISGVVAVSHRNPVVNVLSLVITFFCVAVNYALLGAEFLAAAQILIYAGAILVLFLFVVMLLNAPEVKAAGDTRPFQRAAGLLVACVLAAGLVLLVLTPRFPVPGVGAAGDAKTIGRLLVGPHLFAFELITVVLLTAMVGALVLVKRKH